MGFVITIAQRKGGAGKTTLACQLSAALLERGAAVAGIDLDDQQSFAFWAGLRRERLGDSDPFGFEAAAGYRLWSALRTARAAADYIIIDTPPLADLTVKRAIREADLVLTPLQLTPLDLEATMPTARLIGESAREARFLINRTPPRARIADKIRAEIKRQGLPLMGAEFGNRAAFAESLARGAGVVETAPSSAAAAEARSLASAIIDIASGQRAAA